MSSEQVIKRKITSDNHIVFLLDQCCDVSSHKGSRGDRSFTRKPFDPRTEPT